VGSLELLAGDRGKSIQLGISIGAAVFPDDGSDARALIGAADEAMYADKSQRREHVPTTSVA
jgi:GGDEF domain-containing protein